MTLAACLAAWIAPAVARDAGVVEQDEGGTSSTQVVVAQGPVDIDGRVEEAAWDAATPITELLQFQPVGGGPPPGTTEVRVLQDEHQLFVGIRVRGADYPIRTHLRAREDIDEDDQIGLYFDTFHDGRNGYAFYLNALGIQQDIRKNHRRRDARQRDRQLVFYGQLGGCADDCRRPDHR